MPSQPKPSAHLAVLIDAENASSKIAEALFTEIAKLGVAAGRRIYGDFSSASLKGWTEVLARWALQPQQNFANTRGKNSGDIALVIDAMDLLHSGRFDGFCLVSSDSDFTRLAARIREQGVPVYGFGERKTPESFRQACTRFIYTENLTAAPADVDQSAPPTSATAGGQPSAGKAASNGKGKPAVKGDSSGKTETPKRPLREAARLIGAVIEGMDEEDDGWVSIGGIGNRLRNAYPDFDQRSYGHSKLSDLIKATGKFEVQIRTGGHMVARPTPKR
jgi:uncharacterized LabA/DUF88 family protein